MLLNARLAFSCSRNPLPSALDIHILLGIKKNTAPKRFVDHRYGNQGL